MKPVHKDNDEGVYVTTMYCPGEGHADGTGLWYDIYYFEMDWLTPVERYYYARWGEDGQYTTMSKRDNAANRAESSAAHYAWVDFCIALCDEKYAALNAAMPEEVQA